MIHPGPGTSRSRQLGPPTFALSSQNKMKNANAIIQQSLYFNFQKKHDNKYEKSTFKIKQS